MLVMNAFALARLKAYWAASLRLHGWLTESELSLAAARRNMVSASNDQTWDHLRLAAGATVASLNINIEVMGA